MAGFQTATMPRPQLRARPATPVVDIALVRPQQTPAAIAKRVSASPDARRMTAEQKERARTLAREGWPIHAIAAELHFGQTAICRATKGIPRVAPAASVAARLADRVATQAEVRRLAAEGLSDGEIARRLKLSRPSVCRLKKTDEEYADYLADLRKRSLDRDARERKKKGGIQDKYIPAIAKAIRIATSISLDELRAEDVGQERPPSFVRARQIFCWLAVTRHGCSYRRVGAALGLDHSSVRNGVRAVQAAADTTALPTRQLYRTVTILLDAMQGAAAQRRQAAARHPEIPAP